MLSPFLKGVLSGYDEQYYRLAAGDYVRVIQANERFEELDRLDLRLPHVSQQEISNKLKAAGIVIPAHGVVIDLCCGTGYVARSLLATGRVTRIIGIDLSQPQLNLLRQCRESDPAYERLHLLQADTLSIPLATGSVDMIIGNSFLHHLPDVGAALSEIRRVLRPGGRFVVLHEPSLTATFFESFPLSLLKKIIIENYTDLWQFDPGELERLLTNAGFQEIKILKTGILANSLLGAFSIVINKYFPRWDTAQLTLQYLRGYLSVLEYRFSWSQAPSLLILAD